MHIALIEPEIPQNTGNIARTCAATGTHLHLVGRLGFSIDERAVRRAGLDYWHLVTLHRHAREEDFYEAVEGLPLFYLTTKGGICYADVAYPQDAVLIFGKETKGLPEGVLRTNFNRSIRIPMLEQARSLNLSNAVAIVAYEALRQQRFPGLKREGSLKDG